MTFFIPCNIRKGEKGYRDDGLIRHTKSDTTTNTDATYRKNIRDIHWPKRVIEELENLFLGFIAVGDNFYILFGPRRFSVFLPLQVFLVSLGILFKALGLVAIFGSLVVGVRRGRHHGLPTGFSSATGLLRRRDRR